MVTFSLSLPPSNREPGDVVRAADHNETVTAVSDLAQQAGDNLTALHGQLAQLVTDDDPRLSNPRPPTDHTHPVSELETYGVRDPSAFLRGDGTWAVPPATGGVSDHGSLSGLDDDDHPQYLNVTRGDYRYALTDHSHGVGDLNVGGSADATVFLRGDGQWAPAADPEVEVLRNGLIRDFERDYGAVGDYATDNSAALADAINDLEARTFGASWTILRPALRVGDGVFVFESRAPRVDYPGLTLLGDGSRSTSFVWTGDGPLLEFGEQSSTGGFLGGAHDYQIRGIKFRDDAHVSQANWGGNRPGVAIQDNGCGGGILDDVVIMGYGTGFRATHGADFTSIMRCRFEHCDEGVYLGPGSQQASLRNVTFYHCGEAVVVEAASQGNVDACWFMNSYVSDVTFTSTGTSRYGVPIGSGKHHLSWALTDTWHETGAGGYDAVAPRAIRLYGDGTGEMLKGITVERALYMPGGPGTGHSLAFVEQDGATVGHVTVERLLIRGPHADFVYRNNGHTAVRVLVRDQFTQVGYDPVPTFDVQQANLREEDPAQGITYGSGSGAFWELQNTRNDRRVRLRLHNDGNLGVPFWTGDAWEERLRLEPGNARLWLNGEYLARTANYNYGRTMLRASGDFSVTGRLGVGGTAAATSPGSVVRRLEVFDHEGRSLGFVPIYDDIAP